MLFDGLQTCGVDVLVMAMAKWLEDCALRLMHTTLATREFSCPPTQSTRLGHEVLNAGLPPKPPLKWTDSCKADANLVKSS